MINVDLSTEDYFHGFASRVPPIWNLKGVRMKQRIGLFLSFKKKLGSAANGSARNLSLNCVSQRDGKVSREVVSDKGLSEMFLLTMGRRLFRIRVNILHPKHSNKNSCLLQAETVDIWQPVINQFLEPIPKKGMNDYVAHHNFNGSTDMGNTDEAPRHAGQRYSVTPYITPRLTPSGTPKIISTSASPKGYSAAGSPQKTSGATSPTKPQYDGRASISSWYPSSQQSSAANSPPGDIQFQGVLHVWMERSSFVRPGVAYHMNSSVHFWLTSRN
ncbi:hypothetical protein NC652_019135 [Populus alba x Populus x berolinensis]|nr:hypothetical protein NC652_019135 [Populus alba x Populus x berolinensis]